MYAELVGDAIELNATYRDKERVSAIPGSRYSSPPPTWRVPLTWVACLQLRATFGADGLEIGPGLRAWATKRLEEVRRINELRELLDGPELRTPLPPGRTLRPFQRADVHWMIASESGILMAPTGAGKTIVSLTWAREMGLERVMVICPAGKKIDWTEECALWYPEMPALHATGSAANRRDAIAEVGEYGGLVAVGIDSIRGHSRLAPYGQIELTEAEKQEKVANWYDWDAVIVDEAHRLADPKSKQTRATWAMGRRARFRWALTATSVTKGIDTLWSPLHFVSPQEHPARSKYVNRYATVTTNFWGGTVIGAVRPEMETEFQAVISHRTRRLPKEVVLPELPPMIPILRKVHMTKEQAEAYQAMADKCLAMVARDDVIVATSTAAQYTRLGQLASSYAYLEPPTPEQVEAARARGEEARPTVELTLPSSKIAALLEDLEDWLAQEESVAVFATSRRLLDLLSTVLHKKKVPHSVVKGGQKEIERHEEIERFQKGEVPVILVVIKAGGQGLNLTKARIGAFLQRSWARWEDLQAEGRFLRIGSEEHEAVLRVDYVAPGTVEVGQLDVLASKDDILQQVHRDRELIARMVKGATLTGGPIRHHRLDNSWGDM